MVYELDNWPINSSVNFKINNYLFEAVKLAKNPIEGKFSYNGSRILGSFNGADLCSYAWDIVKKKYIFILGLY